MMTGVAAEGVAVAGAAPSRVYVCPARDQLFLLPVSMREWLDEGHLAWFVLDVVSEMDTAALHGRPGGSPGRPPYDPEMMCALMLYAYCGGVRSSRQIEAACRTDAAFRVICGGLVPDHATIARFVVDHESALEGLFVAGLRLCGAAGLVDLSVVALDGTKIAADASLVQNRDAAWLEREITKLMTVTAKDEQSSISPDGLPGAEPVAEISSSTGRLARLQAALEVIKAEDAAAAKAAARQTEVAAATAACGRHPKGPKPKQPQAALQRAELDHALAQQRVNDLTAERQRRQAAAAQGQKVTGPRLRIDKAQIGLAQAVTRLQAARQAATDAGPVSVRQANITDADSRIMKTAKGWVQGYNAQSIVNSRQIVLCCDVSQDAGDVGLYEPMTARLTDTLTDAGIDSEVGLMLADAGYCSHENLTCPGPDRLIATTKSHKQRRAAHQLGHTDGPPPPGATPIQEMEHLLRTPQGAAAYAQRSCLIEPVFGDHKHNRQMRSFRRRGHSAVRSEWAFMQLAGNMLKLYQHRAAQATA